MGMPMVPDKYQHQHSQSNPVRCAPPSSPQAPNPSVMVVVHSSPSNAIPSACVAQGVHQEGPTRRFPPCPTSKSGRPEQQMELPLVKSKCLLHSCAHHGDGERRSVLQKPPSTHAEGSTPLRTQPPAQQTSQGGAWPREGPWWKPR